MNSRDKRMSLEFDERYLYERWQNMLSRGEKSYLLHDLSPKLVHWTHINESSLSWVKWGGLLMLAAVVVFFSDLQVSMPLLAPSLVLLGLVPLIRGCLDILPRQWTYVHDDDGNFVLSIPVPHNENVEEKRSRQTFETQLTNAIENAKQKEYYDYE